MVADNPIRRLPWVGGLRSSSGRDCDPEDEPSCPGDNIVEVSTKAWDPDRQGVSGSWMANDPSSARLYIPPMPTTAPHLRYLFALCGISVPAGKHCRLIGYRQKLTIGSEVLAPPGIAVKEIPVTTPDWAFLDGNVTTMFRFLPGNKQTSKLGNSGTNVYNQGPARSQDPHNTFTGLLWLDTSAAQYTPTSSGQPPGFPVEGVTDIYDIRNPWNAPNPIMSTTIRGPGDLIMYASVHQTDPDLRPTWTPPPGFDVGALGPEDRFLLAFPAAQYRHIGGAMIVRTS